MLNNLKIGPRLALGFGAVLTLLCMMAALGIWQASRLNERTLDIGTNWLPSVKVLNDMRAHANTLRRASLRHVLESDPAEKAAQAAKHNEVLQHKWPASVEIYVPLINSPEEQKLFEEIKANWAAYLEHDRRLLALSYEGHAGFDAARAYANDPSAASFTKVLDSIEADIELNMTGASRATEDAAHVYRSTVGYDVGAAVVAVLAGLGLGVAMTRSITRPLARAVQVAESVASGDLTSRLDVHGSDETAWLLRGLGTMNDSLARIVGQVRDSSNGIATGSAQIATGSQALSQRTEEQASNLQQTATSMEQLAGTVKGNAAAAGEVDRMAAEASAMAAAGGAKVGDVVATMAAIAESSKRIADIIGVVDGIAFQTNILALNAAVEAARAGEQGRGFAVVASEVRSLAGRSADAAKEIKSLIGASVERVETGARQVQEAGTSMDALVSKVQQVGQLIGQISHATTEQTTGIGQVGDAVSQLDTVTQQNAALVEESAAAAESLREQATTLAEVVGVFKLASASG